jgi:hypothetical protein
VVAESSTATAAAVSVLGGKGDGPSGCRGMRNRGSAVRAMEAAAPDKGVLMATAAASQVDLGAIAQGVREPGGAAGVGAAADARVVPPSTILP